MPTGIALLAFLLTTQLIPKAPAKGLIGIDIAVDGLMANAHLIRDLLWTQLFMQAS